MVAFLPFFATLISAPAARRSSLIRYGPPPRGARPRSLPDRSGRHRAPSFRRPQGLPGLLIFAGRLPAPPSRSIMTAISPATSEEPHMSRLLAWSALVLAVAGTAHAAEYR